MLRFVWLYISTCGCLCKLYGATCWPNASATQVFIGVCFVYGQCTHISPVPRRRLAFQLPPLRGRMFVVANYCPFRVCIGCVCVFGVGCVARGVRRLGRCVWCMVHPEAPVSCWLSNCAFCLLGVVVCVANQRFVRRGDIVGLQVSKVVMVRVRAVGLLRKFDGSG